MTEKELETIRSRAEKATKNYWYSEGDLVVTNVTDDSYEWEADLVAKEVRTDGEN